MSNRDKTVTLTIAQHFNFQPDHPERFDWSIVVNPKVAAIAQDLAEQIVTRRARWENAKKDGSDPLLTGLQEALRSIATRAVWVTMTVDKATAALAARQNVGIEYASDSLPNSRRQLGDIQVPSLRSARI